MENRFQFGEGFEVLLYLQEKLGAEVVYTGQKVAHLKLKERVPDGEIIGINEVAHRRYPVFFSLRDCWCMLYELPTKDETLKYALYANDTIQSLVAQNFGGFRVGYYWLMRNETRSFYGYKGDKLPESSDIIEFIEALLSN